MVHVTRSGEDVVVNVTFSGEAGTVEGETWKFEVINDSEKNRK